MKSILLVDDESLVRETYRCLLPWESYGFKIVAEASNGIEALECMAHHKVDILVTDIRMPGMDGLALLETALKLNTDLGIVVLSAYDDYNLVRKAFNLGAHDYFLKALSEPEELLGVIQKVSRIVDFRSVEMKRQQLLGSLGRKNSILAVLLGREVNPQVSVEGMNHLMKLIGSNLYGISRISVEIPHEKPEQFVIAMEQRMSLLMQGEIIDIDSGEFLLIHLMPFGADGNDRLASRKLTALIRRFHAEFLGSQRKLYNVVYSAGVSSPYDDVSNITEACAEATRALDFRFASGKGSILLASSLFGDTGTVDNSILEHVECSDGIMKAFSLGDIPELHLLLDRLAAKLKDKRFDKEQVLYSVYFPLYMQVFLYIRSQGHDVQVLIDGKRHLPEILSDALTVDDMSTLFKAWMEKLLGVYRSPQGVYAGDVILRTRTYIDRNYANLLRLGVLAREAGVHPNYLSRLFSERVGKSLTTYINEVRIEKSKEALRSSDMRIYEIALSHGFESTEYYCRMFKRIVGMSPKQYKLGSNK